MSDEAKETGARIEPAVSLVRCGGSLSAGKIPKQAQLIEAAANDGVTAMTTLALSLLSRGRSGFCSEKVMAAYRAFGYRRERRAASLALFEMDDHLLKDIGITRSEILAAVYGRRG